MKLNAAIGNGNGMVGIVRNPRNIGSNAVVQQNEHKIPMMAIDSLNLDACDLLQLDVEGYEGPAIEGARKTIKQFRPVIVGERFGSLDQQLYMEQQHGYKMVATSYMDTIYAPIEFTK